MYLHNFSHWLDETQGQLSIAGLNSEFSFCKTAWPAKAKEPNLSYYLSIFGGARGVMVIVTGYGHGDTSSIPGQD